MIEDGFHMTRLLLINPNTSAATTGMMVALAQSAAPRGVEIVGVTAGSGVPMILDPVALSAASHEVLKIGIGLSQGMSGIIVGAFGDPGLAALRRQVLLPIVGIAEASMLEAAAGGRRFGVATTTPKLVGAIVEAARRLGLADLYAGTRLAAGDPEGLLADPHALEAALAEAVADSVRSDRAETVVIGGGPLGGAASGLAARFGDLVVEPIPAAVRKLVAMLERGTPIPTMG
jgi:allantoin racemase